MALLVLFETHSTSVDNEAGLASGWFDAGLSARGEHQARQLGHRHRHNPITAVFCSDLARAFRTAEIAFGDRGVAIVREARLRECDYGALTRHPASEIDRARALHIATPFPGGESYQQVVDRTASWLAELTAAFAGQSVLVIGHRATFYALEHLIGRVPLVDAVAAPWTWQPGWTYGLEHR
jgi:broad specificity phosphatase PhoE